MATFRKNMSLLEPLNKFFELVFGLYVDQLPFEPHGYSINEGGGK